jgi:hypothetical protein
LAAPLRELLNPDTNAQRSKFAILRTDHAMRTE